jgi:putative acetyltransferase
VHVRPYRAADEAAVVAVWNQTKRVAYPYLPDEATRRLEEDAAFFRENVAPRCRIWLACEDETVRGFLALAGSYVDRLYIHPSHQRAGVGRVLLEHAKRLCPDGLALHTHQQNVSACAFYEKHGFRAIRFGSSPPPERSPDVEYRWRPAPPP